MNVPRIHDARFIASATDVSQLPAPMFAEVAFAGRSNVGKSSLINSLLGRKKLVRTSSTPGCTRGLNLFRVEFSDGVLDLVDLPGYGYAKRSKAERLSWGPMIENFLTCRQGLRCIVVILDIRRGLLDDDLQLLEFLDHVGHDVLLVATKLDKLPRNKQKPSLAALGRATGRRVLGYSSDTGYGRDHLLSAVLQRAALRPSVDPRVGPEGASTRTPSEGGS
ncbi:MAG: ribosome biogenesis GTP-binding protein YihA/YsxC [Myxococcales bacterium]|nr:ribosome biogenesis GTP-binding protein YihA/YsxC [Myxococcales bacterium]